MKEQAQVPDPKFLMRKVSSDIVTLEQRSEEKGRGMQVNLTLEVWMINRHRKVVYLTKGGGSTFLKKDHKY